MSGRWRPADVALIVVGAFFVCLLVFAMYGFTRATEARDRTDAYCASIDGFTLQAQWPGTNLCVVDGQVVMAP